MKTLNCDVLIIGGGSAGFAAGVQAARMGAETIIVEETPWLGGMITSAGVSAFDGNKYALGGGIFGELRKMIEDYYGGPDKTFTGWISLTCFEPKIGAKFIEEIANKENKLKVFYRSKVVKPIVKQKKVEGAVITNNEEEITIRAKITIAADEYGDFIAACGIPYRLGRDSKNDTGEPDAPEIADDIFQDITYCAILKKYKDKAPEVKPSKNYNPEKFKCSTAEDCDCRDEYFLNHKLHNWESFITYAALPNEKYLLNWPFRANDFHPSRSFYENPKDRILQLAQAKELTLDYIYYIQTKLGHPEWGLAYDEFPTKDFLPFIPYVRESRRIKGVKLMREQDVVPAENSYRPKLIADSIAVGDYFLDHHHSLAFLPPGKRLEEKLPANAPFQIPYGTLVPEDMDGILAAEKSISVTHIVNGCTRLQPVVMLIGQAAGAAAALCCAKNIQPRELAIVDLQKELLAAGCQLFPYADLYNTNPYFIVVQSLALKGIFVDEPDFKFKHDKKTTREFLDKIFSKCSFNEEQKNWIINNSENLNRGELFNLIAEKIYGVKRV